MFAFDGLKGAKGDPISNVSAPASINSEASASNTYTFYVGTTCVGSATIYNGPIGPTGQQGASVYMQIVDLT